MRIGYVSLNMPDFLRSLDFYQSILGFKTTERPSSERALLSAGGPHPIELLQAKGNDDTVKRAGLYHFAMLLPERKFLADMLENLNEKRDSVYIEGMANHRVSESIHIRDPDFNGIEIYYDRPRSEWSWSGNYIQMATERRDVQKICSKTERTEDGRDARQDSHRPHAPARQQPCKGAGFLLGNLGAGPNVHVSRGLFLCRRQISPPHSDKYVAWKRSRSRFAGKTWAEPLWHRIACL